MVLADPLSPSPALAYLKRAVTYAEKSEHGIYRLGAIIVRNGNVISFGWNKNRTHPKAKNYTRKIHAELAALISDYRNFYGNALYYGDMYVVRVTNGGKMATSKPCKDCWILLKEAGLKSVTYIDEQGRIVTEKL